MAAQLRKYAPFYGVMSAGLFGFGWWVARRVAIGIDKIDPRIEKGKHGW